MLVKAHSQLCSYWQTLKDRDTTIAERRKKSVEYIRKLEALNGMEGFYREFSDAMNIEKFMKDIGLTRNPGCDMSKN